VSEPPRLTERTRGWLRFLHRKATTADDWSSAGRPAPWWDDRSTPPVLDFPRFDLTESSYAIPMLADVTPAWREVYVAIMDGLLARYTTWWGAIDWLTQIGHDPDRAHYPEELVKVWIPEHLAGRYDRPGWTANGVEPWGLAPDPVAAEGNLFFKGWLNLMLGFHAYVSKDHRWTEPFPVTGLEDRTFSWTHDGVNALLARQWRERPEGPHCENTKIWPYCLSAAGLGLQLHDQLTGGRDHWVYDQWLEIARQRFLGLTPDGHVEWMALYHDPLENYTHRAGPTAGLSVAIYLLPQDPALAETLYRTAVAQIGWSDPRRPIRSLPDPRFLLLGFVLAREFGDEVTFARLAEHAERSYEPAFLGAGGEEFGWGFGLGEEHPRGQLNALAMMADIGAPGAWGRVFTEPNLRKFDEPTVSGVDFPRLGIATAFNDPAAGILHLATYAATASARGGTTTLRVCQLPDAGACSVRCDGAPHGRWRAIDGGSLELELDIGDHELQIFTAPPRDGPPAPERRLAASAAAPPPPAAQPAPPGPLLAGIPRPPCPCC
jgi:Linalool dehydratase/isomerase